MAIQQVYAQVFQASILLVASVLILLIGWWLLRLAAQIDRDKCRYQEQEERTNKLFVGWIAVVVGIVGTGVFVSNIGSMLINPGWYAVQLLLGLVK